MVNEISQVRVNIKWDLHTGGVQKKRRTRHELCNSGNDL
ncbi:type VI secretion system contractile sheath small subunit [Photorhabdus heterorhabditis]|uniref:Type VI secretion system contractile sheath small subunit n=1 Tax=Photorhabdus heterorhabditis TaxID=880156 RepID=A0A5B0WID5_9GAMM|nr:type VI secretion system contractile sheath small subunit [Photorhabdus heterorhabditis]